MGNCFSTTSDFCLNKVFQWLEEKGGYNHNLEKNLVDLERAMEELKAKGDDLLRRVIREEDRGLQRLSELQVWLDRVETIKQKVNALLNDRDVEIQRLYVCGFCYGYGENVFLTLKEVELLKSKVFDVIADQAQTSEVQKRPIPRIIVGQETMLETAWKHLVGDGVGIMGMYGMGGVGKTTLLKQIHNKFSDKRCGFNFVIWIVVSKELHVEKIQNEIAEKAGLGGEEWSQKDIIQKGVDLHNFLMKKRFVLFLDDIWEKVELEEIGIPFPTPQNQCKMAFTTRSQGVCASMEAEKLMEVQCLTENEAFDLFQKKVGQTTLERMFSFLSLIKVSIKDCGFLRDAKQLKDIINKEKACEGEESGIVPFQMLKELCLANLPKLKNIYWSLLRFPCLETIYVQSCGKLKKLPLDSKSGKNGLFIRCRPKEWIKGVVWEDKVTKTRFLASCNRDGL